MKIEKIFIDFILPEDNLYRKARESVMLEIYPDNEKKLSKYLINPFLLLGIRENEIDNLSEERINQAYNTIINQVKGEKNRSNGNDKSGKDILDYFNNSYCRPGSYKETKWNPMLKYIDEEDLANISNGKITVDKFNYEDYYDILENFLNMAKKELTTEGGIEKWKSQHNKLVEDERDRIEEKQYNKKDLNARDENMEQEGMDVDKIGIGAKDMDVDKTGTGVKGMNEDQSVKKVSTDTINNANFYANKDANDKEQEKNIKRDKKIAEKIEDLGQDVLESENRKLLYKDGMGMSLGKFISALKSKMYQITDAKIPYIGDDGKIHNYISVQYLGRNLTITDEDTKGIKDVKNFKDLDNLEIKGVDSIIKEKMALQLGAEKYEKNGGKLSHIIINLDENAKKIALECLDDEEAKYKENSNDYLLKGKEQEKNAELEKMHKINNTGKEALKKYLNEQHDPIKFTVYPYLENGELKYMACSDGNKFAGFDFQVPFDHHLTKGPDQDDNNKQVVLKAYRKMIKQVTKKLGARELEKEGPTDHPGQMER